MRSSFASLHPGVSLLYFVCIIVASMVFMHPVMLGISLAASMLYALHLDGRRALRMIGTVVVPVLVLFAVLNPLFNHAGNTVLASVVGMPITLESLAYGLAAGSMFVSVIMWFFCANAAMPSDAVVYLFGRIAPSLALLVTMVVRLVPHLSRQARDIMRAQEGIGCAMSEGSVIVRARGGLKVISILTSCALEHSIDTADSMRSRGYGLPGRTRYQAHQWSVRDSAVTVLIALAGAVVLVGAAAGCMAASYLPAITLPELRPLSVVIYGAWAFLCVLPLLLDGWESLAWARSISRV